MHPLPLSSLAFSNLFPCYKSSLPLISKQTNCPPSLSNSCYNFLHYPSTQRTLHSASRPPSDDLLLSLQLINAMRKKLRVQLAVADLFTAPTIEALATKISLLQTLGSPHANDATAAEKRKSRRGGYSIVIVTMNWNIIHLYSKTDVQEHSPSFFSFILTLPQSLIFSPLSSHSLTVPLPRIPPFPFRSSEDFSHISDQHRRLGRHRQSILL